MSPEWIGAGAAILGLLGTLVGVVWKFSKSVDKLGFMIDKIDETIKSHWVKIDEHGETLTDHGVRIATIETRIDYHEKVPHAKAN